MIDDSAGPLPDSPSYYQLPTTSYQLPATSYQLPTVYIELHCASAFSFLQGASLPETLVERAAALGYPALALLDADGVYGAPRFHKAARKAGLKAIIGAELTIAPFHNPERITQRNDPQGHRGTEPQRINIEISVSL